MLPTNYTVYINILGMEQMPKNALMRLGKVVGGEISLAPSPILLFLLNRPEVGERDRTW